MISGTTTLDATAVLASARRARAAANAAEAQVLADAVEWAHLHTVEDLDEAATLWAGRGQDTGIPIAGDGAPLVSEFAVAEFASALGLSAGSGRNLVAQALALVHRLPRLWARVQAGELASWRARRVAEETMGLSLEAAGFVDAQLAPFAHRTGPAQTQRLVEEAIARFMPEFAAERRQQGADGRHFDIDHQQVSFAGTSRVHGELDLADAVDLDNAVAAGAEELKALGSEDPLDVRRAVAVGIIARGQHALDLKPDSDTTTEGGVETGTRAPSSTTGDSGGPGVFRRREVVLYVHLSQDAIRSGDPDAVVRVENTGGRLLTATQVAEWCGRADTARVVVRPVIDLNIVVATDGYQVPARIAEHVRLRDRTCVHPYCNRPARSCDLDHIDPYDDTGPPGQSSTENLACLCRLHHRILRRQIGAHGGWTYTMLEPGVFLWRSPHGYTYLRDRSGTTDLTPPPVQPPGQPPER